VIGPFLQLSPIPIEVKNDLKRKLNMKIKLPEGYDAQTLHIVIDHIYGINVKELLLEASSWCLGDVCGLATTWGLWGLVDLTAEILSLRVEQLDGRTTRILLMHLQGTLERAAHVSNRST
jgi:hypothetical protein